MIYIHPIGGLGNMFFHISSIWTLAKDNGDELCLLNIEDKINHLMNDKRGDLKHAPIFKYLFNRFPNKIGAASNKLIHPFLYTKLKYEKDVEYVGYFQSEKYFKHRRFEILNILRCGEEFKMEIDKYSNLFGNISLHVRRNDYVTLYPDTHPPQPIEYYERALDELPKELMVLIFSDDLNWCKENFIGDRYVFINEKDYISIYLMSKMKYHVIANSSFSWWGAWLSEYNDKFVIAPNNWFGGELLNNDVDLIPSEWLRL